MESKNYLTKERLEELQAEFEFLKKNKRLEVAERLKRAKEFGDLSENSEYSEAKEEQSQVEGRIFELDEILRTATLIRKNTQNDEVRVGATVVAKKGTKEYRYQIVGSSETKPEEGKISNESPLGKAFLGHKVGEKISFNTPQGVVNYSIISIE